MMQRTDGPHSATLNEKHEFVHPRRMKHEDIPNVLKTLRDTSANSPASKYLTGREKDSRWRRLFIRLTNTYAFTKYVDAKTAWVVDNGDAYICYTDPAIPKRKDRKDKLVQKIFYILYRLIPGISAENENRHKELREKTIVAVRQAFDNKVKGMFYLDHLATITDKQGHGYGTALCQLLNDIVDERGLACYLLSSDVEANTAFYNRVGYRTVKTFYLGDNNPSWNEPPVPVALMLREARPCDAAAKITSDSLPASLLKLFI